jgi:hypothetical protein
MLRGTRGWLPVRSHVVLSPECFVTCDSVPRRNVTPPPNREPRLMNNMPKTGNPIAQTNSNTLEEFFFN